ncbi:Xaa-Pro dipeptidase [Sphingomonas nostoxanthinifaciens]|uniref:Xaa-Pro dipeptidase n=1 Tax=Sphingomonas nostoxanthinifaciens TaxID=2872652 RepID=UPI001CC20327|nr:amidohydrolase family protein [Sphingomonas nostoxanthinifaciens]UAK24453.1 amidohydrolase family protein [Sphingomonas nostoxanthinifaciens]
MKRMMALAAACLLAGTAPVAAATVVTAAHMLDPVKGVLLDAPVVVIGDDGRVVALATGAAARPAIPQGAKRLDLGDVTILPGLIDMHVHLDGDATIGGYQGLAYTDTFWTVVGVANARKMLEAGFTSVRNLGSSNYNDVALKEGIEHGYVPGPRIVPATFLIGALGGHCDGTEGLPPSMSDLLPQPNTGSGPDAMRQLVRKLHKNGAQVIKVCATGGVLSKTDAPGAQQLSFEEMKAIADEAHMLGLKVAAHAHGTEGINDALRAGIDTIEHASLADATSFKLAKERGAWFDMDIYDDDYILAEGAKNGTWAESLDKERQIGRKQRETFRAAHAAGVKMIFGTDNGGVFPAGQNALQFATMVQWGMTPAEAIRAATSDAAIALDRAADVGQLTPGHYGDLIAVAGDPLKDVRLLEHPAWVIKGGVVAKGPGAP